MITLGSIRSEIVQVSKEARNERGRVESRRNSSRGPKKCRRDGRATEKSEIRAAIDDAEHHVL